MSALRCFARAVALLLLGLCPAVAQTTPALTNYQGRLTDANGVNLADGSGYEIEVRLWSASTGGSLVWGARYGGVVLKGGVYSLILGAPGGTALSGAQTTDLRAAFADPTRYLGITVTKNASGATVAAAAELLPRQQLLTTPFSYRADFATASTTAVNAGLASAVVPNGVTAAMIQDGAVTPSKLAANTITSATIVDGTITGADIAPTTIDPGRMALDVGVFADVQPSGTGAQGAVVGWQQRPLNTTEFSRGSSITLANNQIRLAPGIYEVEAVFPLVSVALSFNNRGNYIYSYTVHRGAVRLSGQTTPLLLSNSPSTTVWPTSSSDMASISPGTCSLKGYVVATSNPTSIEFWHYFASAGSGVQDISNIFSFISLLGQPSSIPDTPEVYLRVTVRRVQ